MTSAPYRIAVAAFEHETNTFAVNPTVMEDFTVRGELGAILEGEALLACRGLNFALSGFLNAADGFGWKLLPTLAAVAEPGGIVKRDVYDSISARMIAALDAQLPVDAVYLCLHGAMVVEDLDDPEGDLIGRIRALVGRDVPILASLDLHANISRSCAMEADGLVAYRTFPHIDIAETGARTARLMAQRLTQGPFARAHAALAFLIPPHGQATLDGPMRDIYQMLAIREATSPGVLSLSFNCGFNAADVAFAGPTLLAYGLDQAAVDDAVAAMAAMITEKREQLTPRLYNTEEVAFLARNHQGDRPLTIADVQDNPGGGSGGDCTDLLAALHRAGIDNSAVATIYDPAAVDIAFAAGVGASVELALGGQRNRAGSPYRAHYRVRHLTEQPLAMTGPMLGGRDLDMGRVAVLHLDGIDIVVAGNRIQCLDRGFFEAVGIDPRSRRALVVKSTIHYRCHFDEISDRCISATGRGDYLMDASGYAYKKLRQDVARLP